MIIKKIVLFVFVLIVGLAAFLFFERIYWNIKEKECDDFMLRNINQLTEPSPEISYSDEVVECNREEIKGEYLQLDNESPSHFLNSIGFPADSVLAFNWNGKKTITAYTLSTDTNLLSGFLYLETDKWNIYNRFKINTISEDGGIPEIHSIFTANADSDKDRELVVFIRSNQKHYDYNGTFYEIQVYDFPEIGQKDSLVFLRNISKKLTPGNDLSWREGREEKARFRNAKDVRTELERMGYTQTSKK